ncbi:MAG: sensor histidine kinase [Butyricicoccus sp.]
MIRTLRRRFLLTSMLTLIAVLALLCSGILAATYCNTLERLDTAIGILYENGGSFPIPDLDVIQNPSDRFQVTLESPFEMRYFVARLDADGAISTLDTDHIAAIGEEKIRAYVQNIEDAGKEKGLIDYYRYRVFREEASSTIIVLDSFMQLQAFHSLRTAVLGAVAACVLLVFALLVVLSGRIIRPFIDNLERQRQFITDASHELKTPLTVIAANMGVLEESCGQNKWLQSTQKQIRRMEHLIKNLIELAYTEESTQNSGSIVFDVSELAQAQAEIYQMLAEQKGKCLTAAVEPKLSMRGSPDNIYRMISLLLDNAVKYCDDGGTIRMQLRQKGMNIQFTVSNPCPPMKKQELSRLFDRFYRADSSRSRATGGYGIGLSTVKAIVTRHRGKITAGYADGTIRFVASLPVGNLQ